MKPRLFLHCDASQSKYSISLEGTESRQDFSDLRDALDHAATTVKEETPITIFNGAGKVIVESTISPRPLA